jgi:aspartyl-tRNA(Asn)/glutamyl-tRNA(Gln) amidotransferase subunit B
VDEALAFLDALRKVFIYCDISEARTDRGQMRCDVNVSLAPKGSNTLGTRVEMKNINSFVNVRNAIECEIARQKEALENGEVI